jgi:hypothetical protein
MKVFAPKPFRYNTIDYPYGWQDLTQALADVLVVNKLVSYTDNLFDNVVPGESKGAFYKNTPGQVSFSATGAFAVVTSMALFVEVSGSYVNFPLGTVVAMPTPVIGTDYAIWAEKAGTLTCTANHVSPPSMGARRIGGFHYAPGGNAVAISKAAVADGTAIGAQIVTIDQWALYRLTIVAAGTITVTPAAGNAAGYATEALAIAAIPAMPASSSDMGYITVKTKTGTTFIAGTDSLAGGASGNVASITNYYPAKVSTGCALSRGTTDQNIASTAFNYWLGGDTTPAINPYSFWDLKFRPSCTDPRGMTLVANNFWADIYILNTDSDANGTSKFGATIADGSSPPKRPLAFGGNGTVAYATLNWWEANEVLAAFGKRSASYQEYSALAFGTTEANSIGADQITTKLNAAHTSKWGVIQATGVMYIWGKDFGGGALGAAWVANTGGRGSTYQLPNAAIFGGLWNDGALAGSRFSFWNTSPTYSNGVVSARGVCDLLLLD